MMTLSFTTTYSTSAHLSQKLAQRKALSSEVASVIELYEVFDGFFEVCEVIGRHEMEQITLLKRNKPEAGIRISYGGGSLCYSEVSPVMPRIISVKKTHFSV
jgi:hypothetical protein